MKTLNQIAKTALTRVFVKETDSLNFYGHVDIHDSLNSLAHGNTNSIVMWGIELGIVELPSQFDFQEKELRKSIFENILEELQERHPGRGIPSHIIGTYLFLDNGGKYRPEIEVYSISSLHMSELRMATENIFQKSSDLAFFLMEELNVEIKDEDSEEDFTEAKPKFSLPSIEQGLLRQAIRKYYKEISAKVIFEEGLNFMYSVGKQVGYCEVVVSDKKITFKLY